MATTFVSANRVFAQPEIDGGTFFAPQAGGGPAGNVVVIIRQFSIVTAWVQAIASAGVLPNWTVPATGTGLGTTGNPIVSFFQTMTSSGFFIAASQMSAGVQYAWGSFGIGG